MDLESVQEKLFERKLDLIEYFKAAFDIYKEFLKNNKLLVFSTCLLLMLITSLDIFNFGANFVSRSFIFNWRFF